MHGVTLRQARKDDYGEVSTALQSWWNAARSEQRGRGPRAGSVGASKLALDRLSHGDGFLVEPGTEPAGSVTAKADYDGPVLHRVAFVRTL